MLLLAAEVEMLLLEYRAHQLCRIMNQFKHASLSEIVRMHMCTRGMQFKLSPPREDVLAYTAFPHVLQPHNHRPT